jgi:two-component system, sensor histidine kinase and response regulator
VSNPPSKTPRNLLPLLLTATVVHGWLAMGIFNRPTVMAPFVFWVLLSLHSSRAWHAYLTATLGSAIVLLQAVLKLFPMPDTMTTVLVPTTMLLTLWATAILGVRSIHRARIEAVRSTRAQTMREQYQVQREMLSKLSLAVHTANLWLWETSRDGRVLWEMNRPNDTAKLPVDIAAVMTQVPPGPSRQLTTVEIRDFVSARDHSVTHDHTVVDADGRTQHWQSNIQYLRNAKGECERLLGVTRDISEQVEHAAHLRQQAEAERAANTRLRIAAKSSDLWLWERDPVTRQFVWDENRPASLELQGVAIDDLQKVFGRMIVEEDGKTLGDEVMAAVNSGQLAYTLRYRIMHRGVIRHLQIEACIVRDQAGTAQKIIGITRDVTNEVQVNLMLQRQAEQESLMLERLSIAARAAGIHCWQVQFPEPSPGVDLNTAMPTMVWCENPGAEHGDDYPESDPNKVFADSLSVVHPDDLARITTESDAFFASGQNHRVIEYRITRKDGEPRHVRMYQQLFRRSDGTPSHIIGATQDITAEVEAAHKMQRQAQELLDLHERMARAFNGTNDGLWEIDVQNHRLWLSPRYMAIIGYEAVENTSWTVDDIDRLTHPEDLPTVLSYRTQMQAPDAPIDCEHRMRTRTGEYIWVRVRARIDMADNGRHIRVSGAISNVTEARRTHEALLAAIQEAKDANRAKSAFLANMSHEIRTPMNGIIGMISLLLDTGLDHTQRDFAETIRNSADSLLGVINDILDFSKIEAGKLDIDEIEMDLRASIEDVGSMLSLQASTKHVELVINIHPDVPERVVGDPQRIRQCLTNLIGNALKFTRDGEVVVEVAVSEQQAQQQRVRFEIRDTGIGMTEQVASKLFQPFVQADSSTTRKFGGTGLGLSIVKRLVDMMGGEVGVHSKPGQGSTFWFTLPLPAIEGTATDLDPKLYAMGKHILIVDDNATNCRVLSLQLAHMGYHVHVTASGAEALQHLKQQSALGYHYDVLITDFQMPEMDGVMLAEQVRANPQWSRMQLVLLTSIDRQGDLRRYATMGFVAYLTKPIRARELRDCLNRVLHPNAANTLITRNALQEAQQQQRFQGHVLLVDDNAVNQKVATRLLERMGLTVTVVGDGKEAYEAYQQHAFAIVFMDLQMPVMDGFEATRRIRDFEGWRPRTPIVALTANAMHGEMERCLAVGMDDFLSKPIQINQLRDIVIKYCDSTAQDEPRTEKHNDHPIDAAGTAQLLESNAAPNTVNVDLDGLKALTEGDLSFMRDLALTYIDSSSESLMEIKTALATDDRAGVGRAAHKLKGASANMGLENLRTLSEVLEKSIASTNSEELARTVGQLESALQLTRDALRALLQENQSAA